MQYKTSTCRLAALLFVGSMFSVLIDCASQYRCASPYNSNNNKLVLFSSNIKFERNLT